MCQTNLTPSTYLNTPWMATARKEYFTKILDVLLNDNERHGIPLSSKTFQEAVSRVMKEENKYAKRNVNNVTMSTLF